MTDSFILGKKNPVRLGLAFVLFCFQMRNDNIDGLRNLSKSPLMFSHGCLVNRIKLALWQDPLCLRHLSPDQYQWNCIYMPTSPTLGSVLSTVIMHTWYGSGIWAYLLKMNSLTAATPPELLIKKQIRDRNSKLHGWVLPIKMSHTGRPLTGKVVCTPRCKLRLANPADAYDPLLQLKGNHL